MNDPHLAARSALRDLQNALAEMNVRSPFGDGQTVLGIYARMLHSIEESVYLHQQNERQRAEVERKSLTSRPENYPLETRSGHVRHIAGEDDNEEGGEEEQ